MIENSLIYLALEQENPLVAWLSLIFALIFAYLLTKWFYKEIGFKLI